jgi:PleD family two-component response regulator
MRQKRRCDRADIVAVPPSFLPFRMHFALPNSVKKPIVLIVDDEAAIRMLVAVHCQRGGYGTMLAGDGQQAFGITQTTSFDLILQTTKCLS